jgi:hypothetical protein
VAADAGHPTLARVALSLLPAPAHTFLATAEACRPALEALGLATVIELCGLGLARRGWPWRPRWTALVPTAAMVAFGLLLLTAPTPIAVRHLETQAFDRFAARVGELAANAGLLPLSGRLVQRPR